jgi:hypothetical protein
MGVVIPTVTTYPNGAISVVSTDGTSYESILNSMGSFVYGINDIYLKTTSYPQILKGFKVEQYDVSGYIKSFDQKPTVDPYQYQKSVFFKMTKENVVLNGQTNFYLSVLPNETIYMNIYVTELALRDYLSGKSVFDEEFFKTRYSKFLIKKIKNLPL